MTRVQLSGTVDLQSGQSPNIYVVPAGGVLELDYFFVALTTPLQTGQVVTFRNNTTGVAIAYLTNYMSAAYSTLVRPFVANAGDAIRVEINTGAATGVAWAFTGYVG